MAGRRFLPALRSLFSGAAPEPVETETKSISWSGGAYTSTMYAGTGNIWGTEGRADGWDMDRVITEGYERVVWVFKAIDTIGKHASRLPLELGRGLTEEGEFEETFPDHPLLRLLNGQANPLETGPMFRKRLSAQILLSKRGAFVEKTRSRAGTLTRIDLLPPDRVLPIPDPKGDYLSHFELTTREGVIRELPPERVLWIRDPHPTDPFSGITPLEAAGISVDLDHLSRLYNVTFIKNDARPGGVIAVDSTSLNPQEMDRLESRFLPGSEFAGHMSVIAAGPGGMSYVDTAAKPRDMNYEHASANAKLEILAAFGVPESVTGNASGRTFDNAEQEELGFWLHTELGHLELIANAFEKDAGEDMRLRYDTSTVEVLELPRRKRRQEAREEWNAGLISVDEYRKLSGFPPYANPHTRALWISPQKAPVPLVPGDAAALGISAGLEQGGGGMPGPNAPQQPGQEPVDGAAAQAVAEARGEAPEGGADSAQGAAAAAVDEARATMPAAQPGAAAAAVDEARSGLTPIPDEGPAAAAVDEARRLETKALPLVTEFSVGDVDFDQAHTAAAAALTALFARQEGVIAARLRSPKARKGTPYWLEDGPSDTRGGDKPMDMGKVVGAEKWQDEVITTLVPVLTRLATATAQSAAEAFGGTVSGGASAGIGAAVLTAATVAADTMRAFHRALELRLDEAQQASVDLDELISTVAEMLQGSESTHVIDSIAESAATATVNGAVDAVAAATSPDIERTWQTRRDDRVRPAHAAAEGTTLPVKQPFEMEGWPVRFPGDPLAPRSLTINCRCRLRYRTAPEGEAS
ncbi:phage portal protein [Streptomyces tendae]|uniref:phage portal protein n=1 Tax=Streptomyces tendae TaxID=1932 RepID=UPI00371E021C